MVKYLIIDEFEKMIEPIYMSKLNIILSNLPPKKERQINLDYI